MTNSNRIGPNDVLAKLTGLHTTTKVLASKKVAIYSYLSRGGPLLCKGEGATLAIAKMRLQEALGTPQVLAAYNASRKPSEARAGPSAAYVSGLVAAFLASPEVASLSRSTQTSYRCYLERFRAEFGDWKVTSFSRYEVVEDLVDWRDEYAESPRTADYMISAVSRLFSWARRRGMTGANPTSEIERLYGCDRSEVIWSDAEIEAFGTTANPEVYNAVRLAALTGLRMGDLLTLRWSDVSHEALVKKTAKTGSHAVVPLLPETKRLLAEIPKRGPLVLTNTFSKPWTKDGFKTSFRKARAKAKLEHLRFHDLRGTAATFFALTALDARDIARIMGWSLKHVETLMMRYVSQDRLALDMLGRMKQKRQPTNQRQTKPMRAA